MANLAAISQATTEINRGGGFHPQLLTFSNHPGEIGLMKSFFCIQHQPPCGEYPNTKGYSYAYNASDVLLSFQSSAFQSIHIFTT